MRARLQRFPAVLTPHVSYDLINRRTLFKGTFALAATGTVASASSAFAAEPRVRATRPTGSGSRLAPLAHQAAAEDLVDHLNRVPWDAHRNRYKLPTDPVLRRARTKVVWGSPGHPEAYENLSQCASFQTLVLKHAYGPGTAAGWATPDYFRRYFR